MTGEVIVDRRVPAFANGAVHVRLEEITAADAPARVAAEVVIASVSHGSVSRSIASSDTVVPFAVGDMTTRIDESLEYRVRVWVDKESRGSEGAGDLHSDTACPVLTRGSGNTARLILGPPHEHE